MSLISVIIPVYNNIHTLEKSLDSLMSQTFNNFEIIIVNDGSTDNFEIRMSRMKNKYNVDIKIINQGNKGASAARNRGFAESKGEYVIFWDADTVAHYEMFNEMLDALRADPRASYTYSKNKFGWKIMHSHSFDAGLLKKNNYIDVTSLIRREDFPAFDESLKRFQDWDLWLTMLEQGKRGVFIDKVLYKKIVSKNGISSWLPSFVYKLPWKIKKVREYENAKNIVIKKHSLAVA